MMPDPSVQRDQRRDPKRPRVVIVEDDAALLSALQFSLEAEGYEVRAFSVQTELLARREDFLGASCLLVDFHQMPLDGLELYALLEGMGMKAPAILMTSNPDSECRRGARGLGVKIVEKPLLSDDLSRLIGELVVLHR
jgi:FixJ family two-component response regulator